MNPEALKQAVALSKMINHVLVVTADALGMPHVAAAGILSPVSDTQITIEAWFCPGTVANLENNRQIAIVVWDQKVDKGYQLLGVVEKIEKVAYLNGYAPGAEQGPPIPQVERKLHVNISTVIDFSHAPHSDVEGQLPDRTHHREVQTMKEKKNTRQEPVFDRRTTVCTSAAEWGEHARFDSIGDPCDDGRAGVSCGNRKGERPCPV